MPTLANYMIIKSKYYIMTIAKILMDYRYERLSVLVIVPVPLKNLGIQKELI